MGSTSKPSKPSKPAKPSKPSKPVPLQTTSGGAKLFLDGTVEFGFGGDAFLRPDVKQMGGLIPAASFSNGQKLRFNFGADGTPLAFNPPDNSYLPIWNAYGTKSNIASALPALERRSPVSKRNVQGETKDTNDNGTVNGKDNCNENGGTDEMLDSQLVQLLKLINRKEIRDSLSIALSNPLVAESMQAALESIIASSMSGADRSAIFASLLQEHCVKLLPIGLGLIAKHPELIAVATLLQGVLLPTAGCPAKHHHHHKHRNKCGGGGGGRANRSANWRQQQGQQLGHSLEPGFGVGEQIRQWTGKIVEVAADVANTVHDTVYETVTGNKAREKLNEENLKKAIAASEQDVLDTEKQALQQAVSLSVQKYKSLFQDKDKNTETSKKPVVVID